MSRVTDQQLDRIIETLNKESQAEIVPYFAYNKYGLDTKKGHRFSNTIGTTKRELYDQILFILDWLGNEKNINIIKKENQVKLTSDTELNRVISLLNEKSRASIEPHFINNRYGLRTKEGFLFNSTMGTTKTQLTDQVKFLLDWIRNEKKEKEVLKN